MTVNRHESHLRPYVKRSLNNILLFLPKDNKTVSDLISPLRACMIKVQSVIALIIDCAFMNKQAHVPYIMCIICCIYHFNHQSLSYSTFSKLYFLSYFFTSPSLLHEHILHSQHGICEDIQRSVCDFF